MSRPAHARPLVRRRRVAARGTGIAAVLGACAVAVLVGPVATAAGAAPAAVADEPVIAHDVPVGVPAGSDAPFPAPPRAAAVSRGEGRDTGVDDAASRTWVVPVPGAPISAHFGDSGSHWRFKHTGEDFRAPWGTPARALTDVVVLRVARHSAFGNVVVMLVQPHITVWYCHLAKPLVHAGQHLRAGQLVGLVGATGNATGPHLHVEVRVDDRPTDPAVYLATGVPGPVPTWLPTSPFVPYSTL